MLKILVMRFTEIQPFSTPIRFTATIDDKEMEAAILGNAASQEQITFLVKFSDGFSDIIYGSVKNTGWYFTSTDKLKYAVAIEKTLNNLAGRLFG